jgi:hypothetical protein
MSPEASLRTWMPAIHAGMTSSQNSAFAACSLSKRPRRRPRMHGDPYIFITAGERKLMTHFVVKSLFLLDAALPL